MLYDFSRQEIFRRGFKITDRIQKQMNEYVNIEISYLDTPERKARKYPFDASFAGYPSDINKSKIEISVPAVFEMKCTQQLRHWNAALIISTIHEICHWIIFSEMTIKEREASNTYYEEDHGAQSEIEETHAWVATLKWLKKLRYHRSPIILIELKKFVRPKGFELYPPFCQERKNAIEPIPWESK